jgi:protein phosphatase
MSVHGSTGYEGRMTSVESADADEPSQGGPAPAVWAAITDTGKLRSVNEDAYFVSDSLWAVADGMGGHSSGDVASQLTIEACRDASARSPLTVEVVADLIADANHRVRAYAGIHDRVGMGCTLVGAALVDNGGAPSVLVFNVGDSRCYELFGGELHQVTRDHSYVQELIDAGELDAEAASAHPQRNVVTRAIGIDDQAAADFVVLPDAQRSLRLLLCSDGVHGELASGAIKRGLDPQRSAHDAADALAAEVLTGRAADNLTAVIVDLELPPIARVEEAAGLDPDVTGPRRRTLDVTTRQRSSTRRLPSPPEAIGPVPGVSQPLPPPAAVVDGSMSTGETTLPPPVPPDVIDEVPK